jgi:superfamily II DNA/RNA helicase
VDQQDIRMICLASATSNDSAVNAFADTYAGAGHWRTLSVDGDSAIPAGITHGLISCPKERSLGLLKRFLNAKPAVHSALIFVNDPKRVMGVCRELELAGIVAAPLHGDTNKDDRKVQHLCHALTYLVLKSIFFFYLLHVQEILARIKDGRLSFVVATELAARGLDIPDLTHVVNFELPTDPQHYVHR